MRTDKRIQAGIIVYDTFEHYIMFWVCLEYFISGTIVNINAPLNARTKHKIYMFYNRHKIYVKHKILRLLIVETEIIVSATIVSHPLRE